MRIVILATVVLTACGDSSRSESLVEGLAAAANTTSLDSDGNCRLDGLAESAFILFDDSTVYASGYSDQHFCRLRIGLTRDQVLALLGEPLLETWVYGSESEPPFVYLVQGLVADGYGDPPGLRVGMASSEVQKILGSPKEVSFVYTKRSSDTSYRQRSVGLIDGRVTRISAGVYVD